MTKIALVTGGNSGIGFQTARLLAEKGYQVTISGRDQGRLEKAVTELNQNSYQHLVCYFVVDMENLTGLKELSEKFNSGLDYLVLNAGIAKFFPLQESDEASYNEIMNINVRGAYFLSQYLQLSLEKNKGAISFVSSAIVNNGLKNASIYAMSKGAIDAVVKSLSIELAPHIRVNAISPGAVSTAIQEKFNIPKDALEERMNKFKETIPLKRYGKADELAHVIVAQLESTYVTGAIWDVGGGIHAL